MKKNNLDQKFPYHKHMIAIVFLLAFTTRFAFLGYSTLCHGETEIGQLVAYVLPCLKKFSFLKAMWLNWHMFINNNNPLLNLYPLNIIIAWFLGLDEFSVRLQAAVSGFISCVLVYFLMKRNSDRKTAMIALALVVFNPFLIAFNRIAYQDSFQAMFLLLGLLCLDIYCQKRRTPLLFLCSFCFAIGFLVKPNAILFIIPVLLLYHLYLGLRGTDIAVITGGSIVIMISLFIDQMSIFLPSLLRSLPFLSFTHAKGNISIVERIIRDYKWYVGGAYKTYFEHIYFPLLICLVFLKGIKNRFFKVMVFFSIFYFIALVFQERIFYRYIQIGMITTLMAFAYPVARFTSKKYHHIGIILLFVYLTWGLVAHSTYVLAQYHHIPYRYIRERVFQLSGPGRIFLYGRNSETEYYLSPTNNLLFDERIDPCKQAVSLLCEVTWSKAQKIPDDLNSLFEPNIICSGDFLVVTGIQMAGGEPNPLALKTKKWGITFWGVREYGHTLQDVKAFYDEYTKNRQLQQRYELVEKIFLTNGSKELGALILKKR